MKKRNKKVITITGAIIASVGIIMLSMWTLSALKSSVNNWVSFLDKEVRGLPITVSDDDIRSYNQKLVVRYIESGFTTKEVSDEETREKGSASLAAISDDGKCSYKLSDLTKSQLGISAGARIITIGKLVCDKEERATVRIEYSGLDEANQLDQMSDFAVRSVNVYSTQSDALKSIASNFDQINANFYDNKSSYTKSINYSEYRNSLSDRTYGSDCNQRSLSYSFRLTLLPGGESYSRSEGADLEAKVECRKLSLNGV